MARRLATVRMMLLIAAAIVCALPATANARLFTVFDQVSAIYGAPFIIDATNNGGSGVFGTINPVFSVQGGSGFVTDSGNPPNFGIGDGTNDFFIFDLTLAAGSRAVDQISVFVDSNPLLGEPTDAGYFIESGQSPIGVATDPLIQLIPFPIGTGTSTFDFGFGTRKKQNNINAGETTVRMFIMFSTPTSLLEHTYASFMISPVGAADFTVQTQIIPEPSTLLLLGGGLLGLAGFRRKRVRGKPGSRPFAR